MDSSPQLIPDEQLLRIDDLVKLTTLSKSCINLWVAQGRFPKPAVLSSTVRVWKMAQIRCWLDSFAVDCAEVA
jgi:predicted DNA-binding transcriptional regulator AlpA